MKDILNRGVDIYLVDGHQGRQKKRQNHFDRLMIDDWRTYLANKNAPGNKWGWLPGVAILVVVSVGDDRGHSDTLLIHQIKLKPFVTHFSYF